MPQSEPPTDDTGEFASGRSWTVRLSSGIARRWQARHHRPAPIPRAWQWLLNQRLPAGLPRASNKKQADWRGTALAIPWLVRWQETATADHWLTELLSHQRDSGAFPGLDCPWAAIRSTAAALVALASQSQHRAALAAGRHAAQWLAGVLIGDRGAPHADPPRDQEWLSPADNTAALASLLPFVEDAAPVLAAARQAARQHDLARWDAETPNTPQCLPALWQLGLREVVARVLDVAAAMQRRSGEVPAYPGSTWISTPNLAALAECWYQSGDHTAADQALRALFRHQNLNGSWAGSWGRGANYLPHTAAIDALLAVLPATAAGVAAEFARPDAPLHDSIAPHDGRFTTVLRWAQALPPGARVADLGCGRGRYLRLLRERLPHLRWIGIDPSAEALSALPPTVECRRGSFAALPAETGELDAAFAVEALEHALLAELALREMCRVVRPGGELLIIDKHASRQALSQHAPWEQWFDPAELTSWLGAAGSAAAATTIAMPGAAAGLFFAWQARRASFLQRRLAA